MEGYDVGAGWATSGGPASLRWEHLSVGRRKAFLREATPCASPPSTEEVSPGLSLPPRRTVRRCQRTASGHHRFQPQGTDQVFDFIGSLRIGFQ